MHTADTDISNLESPNQGAGKNTVIVPDPRVISVFLQKYDRNMTGTISVVIFHIRQTGAVCRSAILA